MADLNISIEDEVLRRAQIRAIEQDTSVNSVLCAYLEAYAAPRRTYERMADTILRISRQAQSGRGEARWTRDELHER